MRNAALPLKMTAESVFGQQDSRIHYYVVDGASTDDTAMVLEELKPRLKRWVSEPDKGIYDAMNKAAKLVSEPWIIFMNAGDIFADSRVLAQLSELLDDSVDVLLGACYKVQCDESGTRVFLKRPEGVAELWYEMPTTHQAIVMRTDLLRRYGFDTKYKWCADHDLLLRLKCDGYRFAISELILSKFDCAGGQARDPRIYIKERWEISRKGATWMQRAPRFAVEWMRLRFWGPLVSIAKPWLPRKVLVMLRKIRGTQGVSTEA